MCTAAVVLTRRSSVKVAGLDQVAVAVFVESGRHDRHLRRMVGEERRQLACRDPAGPVALPMAGAGAQHGGCPMSCSVEALLDFLGDSRRAC